MGRSERALTEHFRHVSQAFLVCDIVEDNGGMDTRRGTVVGAVCPLDVPALAHLHVGEGHFDQADYIDGAINGHSARAIAWGCSFGQAECASGKGRFA